MDCNTSLEDIISRCLETGINCIAIADHDAIEGALKMQGLAPFPVIVAQEILTPQGEIMGMFLKEGVPTGLPIERLEGLTEQIDIIEVFNARSPLLRYSTKAQTFAQKYGILETAGSDAHTLNEIGNTYVEMPEFNDRDDFLQALRKGKIHRHRSSLLVHFSSTWTRLKKSF